MRRRGSAGRGVAAALFALSLGGVAAAQTDPGDHSAHHPPPRPSPAAGATAPASPGGGGATTHATPPTPGAAAAAGMGCGGMMGCMGAGPRPFYATLLGMPALTPEARRFIEDEAQRRIGWGSQAIATGQARLHHALAEEGAAAVERATAGIREGLLLLESGTAALRVTEAGTPPRQLALAWFRDQLGVPSADAPMAMDDGPWGLSWYHLTTMAFLVAFLLGTLLIQYARMRRVGALVQRLSPAAAPAGGTGPAPSGVPPSPGPGAAQAAPIAPDAPTPDAPAAPSGPTAALPRTTPGRPWKGLLRVAAIFPETPNVKTFRLMEPEGVAIPFTFHPGQFLTFSAEIEGRRVSRSYTIASSPSRRDHVEITVKREEQGLESRHLHDRVKVGDLLEVSGPAGAFTFAGRESDSIVLIAGGVGITPMMSVIRFLTDRAWPGEIHFLYGARSTLDFIFRDELEYLQRRHPNLHVAATMSSRAEGTAWMGPQGQISREFIARSVPDIARRRVHLCGPPPMMEAVQAALTELGVPKEQVRTEAFGPAKGRAAVAPVAPIPTTPAPAGAPAAVAPAVPAAVVAPPTATAKVDFLRSGKTAPLAPDQTVLEAAEAVGVAIDYSCRVGTCGTCMVPLKAGAVTMEVEDGLPPEERARGMILACQAKSVGNLLVEA